MSGISEGDGAGFEDVSEAKRSSFDSAAERQELSQFCVDFGALSGQKWQKTAKKGPKTGVCSY
jgi:hypothetical protein